MKNLKATGIVITILFLWIVIMVVGRIIPHIPNMVPLTVLSILAGAAFRKSWAIIITLVSLVLSDIFLGWSLHHSIFGGWTLFTYTGCLLVAWFAPSDVKKNLPVWVYLIFSTFGYWLWTNLGTWLTTYLYPHNFLGLWMCFIAGLPFLRNAFMGNAIYMVLFLPVLRGIVMLPPLNLLPFLKAEKIRDRI